MDFMHFLAGLGMVIGICAAIATAATLWMIGMARLERSAVRVEPHHPRSPRDARR
ncbi:hypothetical protein K6U06_10030 [Acidiferrimicrobium sp. IK]|uniref:hypothetical protein n=1 Tax=Acidiferrimicrobium sp. IK TaxID=2871700 RepID=UPI0021CB141A|nr:hypothetical protein [Acidiferrimicrobium sp. IK]MCU4184698.1 hypothetical protein [Acidiferrimicrobium sp. IK]